MPRVRQELQSTTGTLDLHYLKLSGSLSEVSNHSHTVLTDIGTNTHAQIDTFIGTTVPGTYANQALSNLASVAINTSLISDIDSTDNLGSTTVAWANLYVDTISSITGNPLALTPVAGQSLTVNLSTTGDFAVNTSQLYVDTSTGNVGIGTTNPGAKLDISKSVVTTPHIKLAGNGQFRDTFPTYGALDLGFIDEYAYSGTGPEPWVKFLDLISTGTDQSNIRFLTNSASGNATEKVRITGNGNVGIGITSPTAILNIKAGTATANTAPLKFTSGTSLTTAEAGAVEFTTDDLYFTITTGATRKGIILNDGSNLTSGRVPFVTTNGRLTDDADMTFATDTLTLTKLVLGSLTTIGTTAPAADGTYALPTSITIKSGIITAIS